MTVPPSPGGSSWGTGAAGPPSVQPIDRLRQAYQRRHESDYIFSFWTALGWSILTLGVFYFYVLPIFG